MKEREKREKNCKRPQIKILFLIFLFLLLLLFLEFFSSYNFSSYIFFKDKIEEDYKEHMYQNETYVLINGIKINVEVALTPTERSVGLMNRTYLSEYSGMLFVFENDGYHAFWMKNTLIPLEITFIDKDGKIVEIMEMEPCKEIDPNNCKLYIPHSPIRYALELNQNFSSKQNIKINDTVQIKIYEK